MTSRTEKPQPVLPKEALEMLATQDQAMSSMGAMIAQLQRVLWLAVQAAGGRVQLKEGSIDPCWRLDKVRMEDGTLILTASITPPPSEETLSKLADRLRGTDLRVEDVQKDTELDNWPALYLVTKLAPMILWHGGRWTDAALVKGASEPTGQN